MNEKVHSIMRGVLLILLIWAVDVFIAFVPFSIESNTRYIILTWLVIDILIIFSLKKANYFDKTTTIISITIIFLLILSYFIPINSNIPQEAIELNNQISKKYENKYDYAKALFFAVEEKYGAPIRQYLLEPGKVVLIKDFAYFWNLPEGDYVDSSVQAQIYQKLLLQSSRFKKEELPIRQGFCSNSPHAAVKIIHPDREVIYADFWAVDNFPGVNSNRTYEFGLVTIPPCEELIGKPY